MAEHRIIAAQPARVVVHNDYTFEIHSDGEKLGSLAISKGGVDWWPKYAQLAVPIEWEDFAALLDGYAADPVAMKHAASNASEAS